MKCLGLIGSLTAPNLESYYRTIRNEAQKSLGADQLPEFLLHCVKTREIRAHLARADWPGVTGELIESGRKLIDAGAEGLVICGSALNPVAAEVWRVLSVPVIDLGYSVAVKLRALQHGSVSVLGCRSPEEEAMWEDKLEDVTVVPLSRADRAWLLGCMDASGGGHSIPLQWKIDANRVISGLRRSGARALVLAEPSLSQWILPGESLLYPIDAVEVHAWIAALWALESRSLPTPPCLIEC